MNIEEAQKATKEAIDGLTARLVTIPDDCHARFERAVHWIGLKEYDKAIDDLKYCIRLCPQYPIAHEVLKEVVLRKKSEAQKANDRLKEQNYYGYIHLAMVQIDSEEYDKALDYFLDAIRIHPKCPLVTRFIKEVELKKRCINPKNKL